jgi:hypothetical protein
MKYQLLPVCVLALAMTGCMASVGGSIDDRSIAGHSGWFSSALLQPTPTGQKITLGGKTVQISLTELTWAGGGRLQLPPTWTRLEFSELFDSLVVSVDGQRFASIRPGSLPNANVISGGVADH